MLTRHQTKTAALTCLVLWASASVRAEDPTWPGWLGPERNGWVPNFESPAEWPENLSKAWELEVGTGYGSPLVDGGRIFQHARVGEEEVLWCIELVSGNEIWRNGFEVPFKVGGGGEWHGKGPKSSPILSENRVFTFSINGVLSAWSAEDGKILWQRDYSDSFGDAKTPYWGACTSPIVDGAKVIVHFGSDSEGMLVALDVATGEEVWRSGSDGAAYSSPLIATIQGTRQLVEWNHNGVAGVDLETGQRLWFYSLPHEGTQQNMPTPSVHRDHIVVGGENRGVQSVSVTHEAGTWKAEQVWHQKDVALDMSSAVLNGDLLFGFSHYKAGQLFCLDTQTGQVLWTGPGRTGQNATFLSIPGHVVSLLDNGQLQIIEATGGRYNAIAKYTLSDSPTWAPPVVLPKGILIKAQETVSYWTFP